MFMKKITEKLNKVEAILIRLFYRFFIKFFEKQIINKIKLQFALRLMKIETAPNELLDGMDEDKRRELIGEEWFKYNQWMRDPTLSECWARVHWQLNKEFYVRYSREYYREVEKRVYMMRPDIMKKYHSHNN